MAPPAQNLGPPRTENRREVNTKEYASVRPRNQIWEVLQYAFKGFKEIPQKCSTNSIWTHQAFFKVLAKRKKAHTTLPFFCSGIITKQLWKTPFTHPLQKSKATASDKTKLTDLRTQDQTQHITPQGFHCAPWRSLMCHSDSVSTAPFPQEDWNTLFLDTVQGYTEIIDAMGLLSPEPYRYKIISKASLALFTRFLSSEKGSIFISHRNHYKKSAIKARKHH